MLATSFVSGVVRPAAVSSRKSTFAGSSSSLCRATTLSVRAPESRVVQVEGMFVENLVGSALPRLSPPLKVQFPDESSIGCYFISTGWKYYHAMEYSRMADSNLWETCGNGGKT